MISRAGHNRLPLLADQVRQHLEIASHAERSAIEAAMSAGALLCEAKACARHGEWLPFLEAAGVPERKAQRYMQLAGSGLKSDTVSDLGGIKATLRWLERLRLPAQDEILMVGFHGVGAPDYAERVALAWTEICGIRFCIIKLDPSDCWIDQLRRPLVKTEMLWPLLFSIFDHRHSDLSWEFLRKRSDDPAAELMAW